MNKDVVCPHCNMQVTILLNVKKNCNYNCPDCNGLFTLNSNKKSNFWKKTKLIIALWGSGFGDAILLFPFIYGFFSPFVDYKEFLHQAFSAPQWMQDSYVFIVIILYIAGLIGIFFTDREEMDEIYADN